MRQTSTHTPAHFAPVRDRRHRANARHAALSLVCVLLFASTARAQSAPPTACEPGRTMNADTQGHCCWPSQAWSTSRSQCVGVPTCPPGHVQQGEDCVSTCPAGQSITPDTSGHCCWPSQVWAASRGACIGIPSCPPGTTVQGETCVGAASPPVAAPPTEATSTSTTTVAPPPVVVSPEPTAVCPAGQVSSAATAGHCCWPGQTFDVATNACAGAPTCPGGWISTGTSCVASATEAGVVVTYGRRRRHRERYQGGPIPPGMHLESRRNVAMLAGGAALLGAGYLLALIGASVGQVVAASNDAQYGFSCASETWWGYVPLIGPVMAGATFPNHDLLQYNNSRDYHRLDCASWYGPVVGYTTFVEFVQLAGVALMIGGAVFRQHYLVTDARTEGERVLSSLAIVPTTTPSEVGLALMGAF